MHLNHSLADAVGHAGDQGISHAEGSMAIGHAGVRPALRESLELIELVGNESSETAVGTLDDVLKAAGTRATFAGEDGAAWLIGGIREAHGTLGIRVRKARLFVGALFALTALEVAPVGGASRRRYRTALEQPPHRQAHRQVRGARRDNPRQSRKSKYGNPA